VSLARSTAERWKPAVRVRTQLAAASLLWTCVGLGLGAVGVYWCHPVDLAGAAIVALGLALGALKGWLVIRPIAHKNSARIVERGDGRCLGGFLSWKSWLMVASMMAVGAVLRHTALPRPILGVAYVAIGAALLLGAEPLWRAFAQSPRAPA
jgi:hypothetical protein